MSEERINVTVGDRVKLKSGGPLMRVEAYEDNPPRIVCSWKVAPKKRKRALFPAECLMFIRHRRSK